FFFLLRRHFIFGGSQAANLSVGIDKLATELLKFTKLDDFAFRFVDRSGRGQRFGDALAGPFLRESEVWTMAGLAGLNASAGRLATPARRARHRTRAEITKLADLPQDLLAALLEIGKAKGHIVAS